MASETDIVQFIVEYDNTKHPFAETPTKMRFFATLVEMDDFIDKMDPDERVLRALRQDTHITRRYYFGHE